MAESTLEAAQQRLDKLMQQKKDVEAKISRERTQLRAQERKARTRRLVEYGTLVEMAELDHEDQATMLGMLLEGARRLKEEADMRRRWKEQGDGVLAAQAPRTNHGTNA